MRNLSRGLRCGCAVKSGSLAFTLVAALWAQNSPPPQPVVIPNAERRMLKSAINGTEYQIDVALPRGYSASGGKRYPVVYTLDGIAYFALITDTVRLLQVLRDDLVVVGIGYPAKTYPFWDDAFGAHRALDYSTKPTKPSPALRPGEFPMGPPTEFGGAPAFLRFLREELIPYVDSTYRTVPDDRTLVGHSFGGLFAVYVLTHAPDTFRNYAIGSPSLWFDDEVSFRWESEYASSHKDLRARVVLYFGCDEPEMMTVPPSDLSKRLQSRHYAGLEIADLTCVPGETHTSVNISSIERALREFYGRRPVPLSQETLNRFAGDWTAKGEALWRIRVDGDHLVLYVPGSSLGPRQLFAGADMIFRTNMSMVPELSATFQLDESGKTATELKLVRVAYLEAGVVRPGRRMLLHRVPASK